MSVPVPASTADEVLYSGPLPGLADISASLTRRYLFDRRDGNARERRPAQGWLKLRGVTRNNLDRLDVDIPLGVLTSVTGVSGSGKSSLISQFLVEAIAEKLGQHSEVVEEDD